MTEHYIDAIGFMCPVPNMMVQEKLEQAQQGDVIILETDHSCAAVNIINDMKKKKIRAASSEIDNGIWRVVIRL